VSFGVKVIVEIDYLNIYYLAYGHWSVYLSYFVIKLHIFIKGPSIKDVRTKSRKIYSSSSLA